ncbi:WxL domain-containing protein [Vagococcus sp. DIV0080]|uniref:WxL domain-containing protein n=1 Tax=Candidatus Vagococcus giribetii TaxID=2230876 RepID=A0ABS3HUE5_9ENTE|nr:WxL domain-containing protein [Vagococcus sp. DIV0080]MBO0477330.1 WxL domain-containing protein [Vagococcus sp. DIV0080]
MKKTTLISGLVLSTIILGAVPFTAHADSASTYGDVTFEANDDKEGGNPGEPKDGSQVPITNSKDPNDPNKLDGSWGKGSLRLEWVPNFHFGTQKISSADSYYPTAWQDQVTIDPSGAAKDVKDYPQYAQVTDESGKSVSKWRVNVKQTVFKGKDGAKDVELPNTMITLFNTQAYNSNSDHIDPVEAQKMTKDIFTLTDVKNETSGVRKGTPITTTGIELGQSTQSIDPVKGKTPNGTKTSIVFAEDDQFNGEVSANRTGKNEAVKLFSPAKDVKVSGVTYKADLVWDLVVAP